MRLTDPREARARAKEEEEDFKARRRPPPETTPIKPTLGPPEEEDTPGSQTEPGYTTEPFKCYDCGAAIRLRLTDTGRWAGVADRVLRIHKWERGAQGKIAGIAPNGDYIHGFTVALNSPFRTARPIHSCRGPSAWDPKPLKR